MLKDYETKQLKINLPVRGHKAGDIVRIKVGAWGMPIDPYWRRRLKDARIDGCVEIVKPAKPVKQTKEEKKGDSK